jgi:hypothetical protein
VKRRKFITLLGGGVAATWSLAARATAGDAGDRILDGQSIDLHLMTAFREALKDAGYTEGRNVAIYFRSADGQTDRGNAGGGYHRPARGCDCHNGRRRRGACGLRCNHNDSNRLRKWRRSGFIRPGQSLNRPGGHATGALPSLA